MESEININCLKIRGLIDRMMHAETITDEDTAQIILHTDQCEDCRYYLNNALQTEKKDSLAG